MIASLNNVTVSYRDHLALKNICLDIPKGSFVSVIGPNGAGKTTLLTVINGLGEIVSGRAFVLGREVKTKNLSRIRKRVGYVPQHQNIDRRSPISVRDAVCIGRFGKIGLFGSWAKRDDEIVRYAMEKVGIAHLSQKPIGHLSGGENQKVSTARAMAQEPEIILLDEPTSNLDPRSQHEILRLVEKIYDEHKYTVIFVTHILNHIPASCNLVVLVKNGAIIHKGSPDETLKENMLSELYGCKITVVNVHGKRHFHTGEYQSHD